MTFGRHGVVFVFIFYYLMNTAASMENTENLYLERGTSNMFSMQKSCIFSNMSLARVLDDQSEGFLKSLNTWVVYWMYVLINHEYDEAMHENLFSTDILLMKMYKSFIGMGMRVRADFQKRISWVG